MRRSSSEQNEYMTIEHFSSFDFRDAFSSFEIISNVKFVTLETLETPKQPPRLKADYHEMNIEDE